MRITESQLRRVVRQLVKEYGENPNRWQFGGAPSGYGLIDDTGIGDMGDWGGDIGDNDLGDDGDMDESDESPIKTRR